MSHVDEGRLHAWLDYGRSGMSEAEYIEIGAHLKRCAECSALLAEERALRDRAGSILGATGPRSSSAPSFDELTARARASGRLPEPSVAPPEDDRTDGVRDWSGRRSNRQLVGLAWAASLMAALGLGWIASTLMEGDQLAIGTVESTADAAGPRSGGLEMAASTADNAVAGKMAAPSEAVAEPSAGMAAPSAAMAAPESSPMASNPTPGPAPVAPPALTITRQTPQSPTVELPDPASVDEVVVVQYGTQSREPAAARIAADQVEATTLRAAGGAAPMAATAAAAEAGEAAPAAAPPPAAPAAGMGAMGFATEPALVWEVVSAERAAERLGGQVLTHPAFLLLRIEVPTAEGIQMARVIHILPGGGGTLTITQSRTEDGEATIVTPPGSATIMRGDLVVTGAGPISPDSITTLLEGLR